MRKKLALIISGVLFATPALAANNYSHCFDDNSTEVCKAFLAGLETTQPEVVEKASLTTTPSVDKDTLLGRALEQRAGGRYKTSTIAKKG
ncbi:hypothetical protein RN22_11720 [Grimontia sp. AD028]|uniref:Uncharacterized protein n=1 Tax=Grimontia marina TaxID=646534 RepID=A0A128EYG3_9GAMM|nr:MULTISPECIES: hypothetical protein [Grimontia]KKD60295.1 hypothetical protein RN22_11720 [Grimontia sp. AD028]CZF79071.1 hypothetical protein GMA8713_00826 [Grimontia marina]